jgi:hypothetical protein
MSTESGTMRLDGFPKDAPLLFSAYLPTRMDRSFYLTLPDPQFLTALTALTRASRVGYS